MRWQRNLQFFYVKVFDGATIVHMLSTTSASTFDEYASEVFIPYLYRPQVVLIWYGIPTLPTVSRNLKRETRQGLVKKGGSQKQTTKKLA